MERNVLQMSRRAQLTEDQEHELVRSVRITYGIPVPPVPVLDENKINLVVAPDAVPTVVRALGTVVSGAGTAPLPPVGQTAPILVVGRVVSSHSSDSETADGPQSAALQPSELHVVRPVSSSSAPPPLPPPRSPSLTPGKPPLLVGEARSRVSVTAEGQITSSSGNNNSTTIIPGVGTKNVSNTDTVPASENSFLSYFSRNNKGVAGTGGATPGNSVKTASVKSTSTSAKRPSVGKPPDHDDFFAVL